MRIVIDLQACQCDSRSRGIGRYSMSLAQNMAEQLSGRGHDVWLILSDRFPETIDSLCSIFEQWIPVQQIVVFSALSPLAGINPNNEWRLRAAELVREYFLAQLQPDYVHVSSLFEGWGDDAIASVDASDKRLNTAVTLYDLIPYVLDDIYLQDENYKIFYYHKIEQLKKSSLLLAISDHSRQEAIELLDFDSDKIVNISSAIDEKFREVLLSDNERTELLSKYNITQPFVLYVPGGFDPRKNFERLIEAFTHLPENIKKQYQLVIASKLYSGIREPLENVASSHGLLLEQFVLTDYVPDEDLIALYSSCTLYVFPSIHEGFGLPALEAMACGAAVIGANTTSIPEVIGREDALFDPYSIESISNKILEVLTDNTFLDILKAHSLSQSTKFSWKRSASLAVNAIETSYNKLAKKNNIIPPPNLLGTDEFVKNILNNIYIEEGVCEPTKEDLALLEAAVRANMHNSKVRQLFVDISQLVTIDAKSGIQRVVRSILLRLLKNPPKDYLVIPVYSQTGELFKQAMNFTAKFLGEDGTNEDDPIIHYSRGDVLLGLDLTAHLFPAINGVLEDMREQGVKVNYVVYDLTPLRNPEWHAEGTTTAFVSWIDSLARYADGLICISEAVASDVNECLAGNFPAEKDKVKVGFFHLGSDINNSIPTFGLPDNARNILKIIKQNPSFLSVATIEPRKGYAQLLSAFEQLWGEAYNINLLIVGKAGWNTEELIEKLSQHPELNNRLFWLEGISDEYLEKIYKNSTCLIAASESEGFGLPLIEAAQQKLPIIARDIPVFREVTGEHAYYFSGVTAKDLASSIEAWLLLYEQGRAPASDNMPWITWEESTNQLFNEMKK